MDFSSTTLLLLCAASLSLFLASPASAFNHLLSGEILKTGDTLSVGDGSYIFIMQSDCNLVLYRSAKPLWASHTEHKSTGCYLTLRHDGNLVISNFRNKIIWKSDTNGEDGKYILILEKNGNVALYKQPIWETGTGSVTVEAGNPTAAA